MKYCSKCGNELMDEAVICVKCGCPVEQTHSDNSKKSNSKIQTAFVMNIIALIISFTAIAFVMLFMTNSITIGERTPDKKTFSELLEMKREYEEAEREEEKFLFENRDNPEVKEYIELEIDEELETAVEQSIPEVQLKRVINNFTQGKENSKIAECINLTIKRAEAEKRFEKYEDDYEGTRNGIILFGFLFILVFVSFALSIAAKIQLNKNSKKKLAAWIYLIFVLLEDMVYVMMSFILFIYILCGIGILVPVAPILQTIAAVKFLQATKE